MMISLNKRFGCSGLGVARCPGEAIPLDAEIVFVHVDVEETIVSPVRAPRVASNPVFLAFSRNAVANNRDLMIEQDERNFLRVNVGAIVIVLEVVSNMNTTRNGTILELSLHLVSSSDFPVLTDVVANIRSDSCAVFKTVITNFWRRSMAVATDIDRGARASNIVEGDVVHAGSVYKTFRHCELIDLSRVSAIAGTTSIAVDDHLGV